MKTNIYIKNLLIWAVFFSAFLKAQVAAEFNNWTARYAIGNYSQATTVGTWYVTRGNIYPKGGNGVAISSGYVELATSSSTAAAGTLTTPAIPKGGAKTITIKAAVRPANINYAEYTTVLVEKSVAGGAWISLGTKRILTPKTLTIENLTYTVNDSSNDIKFRISRTAGKSIFLDRVLVDHSFNLFADNNSVCPNTTVTLTAESSAPFIYTWSSTTGGNLQQTTGSTVTAKPGQTATYTAVGTYTNSYGTFTDTKVINVNTNATPTATLTGGGTIDTEPASVILPITLTGTAPWTITYTINGTNQQTISGITSSPYLLAVSPQQNSNYQLTGVSDASCSGTAVGVASVIVNKTIWKEENGTSAWTNGEPSSALNTYIFAPYATVNYGSFIAKGLTIDNEGSLTVSSNNAIGAEYYVNNLTADKFVLQSDANLMQTSNTANTGNLTVNRIANMAKMHYTFWSSPVTGQNLYSFSDGGLVGGTPKNRFFVYNEANDLFVTTGLNDTYNFKTGQGYAIRGKNSYNEAYNSPLAYMFNFVGVPNNGNLAYQNLKYTNANHGYNLVGNPYPSNLDFDALYDANDSLIYGTAYFWTNQQYIAGQQGSNYAGSNYAIYNRSGGVPASFQGGVASPTPTQYIKVGQGFLVQTKAGANNQPLQFTNAMRSYSPASIFFNRTEAQNIEKDRFWLNLKSPSNINNTILLSYVQGATNDYERLYDADLLVVGSDAFYSVNGAAKLAIQGRKYPLSSSDEVILGAKYFETGLYTIALKNQEGIFANNQAVYLKDNKLNKIINLTETKEYQFAATAGTDNTRFEIVYQDLSTTSTNRNSGTVNVIKDDTEITVLDTREVITSVEVYDASGKLLKTLSGNNSKEIKISTFGFVKGVYILKITSDKGVISKKVIL